MISNAQTGLYEITPDDIAPDQTVTLAPELAGAALVADGTLAQVPRTELPDGSERLDLGGFDPSAETLTLATHPALAGPAGFQGRPDPSDQAAAASAAARTHSLLRTPRHQPRTQPSDQDTNLPPQPDTGMLSIEIAGSAAWTAADGHAARTPLVPRRDPGRQSAEAAVMPTAAEGIPAAAWMELADSDGDPIARLKGLVRIAEPDGETGGAGAGHQGPDGGAEAKPGGPSDPNAIPDGGADAKPGDGEAGDPDAAPTAREVGSWPSDHPVGRILRRPDGSLSFRWDFGSALSERLLELDSSASGPGGRRGAGYKFRIRFRRSDRLVDGFVVWRSWSPWAEFDINVPPSAPGELRLDRRR